MIKTCSLEVVQYRKHTAIASFYFLLPYDVCTAETEVTQQTVFCVCVLNSLHHVKFSKFKFKGNRNHDPKNVNTDTLIEAQKQV